MIHEFQSMGLLRIRGCCLFTWRQREYGTGPRQVEVWPYHCVACVHELRAMQPPVVIVQPRSTVLAPIRKARRVLVIDDEQAIREALTESLEDVGCVVAAVASGREALAHLRAGGPLPELILLDLLMPEMDGYQFRAEQEKDPALANIPVVVVTAVSKPGDLHARKILRKPLTLESLLEALEIAPSGARRRRVLVVEDEPEVRAELQEALEEAGCEVTTASNGREALANLCAGAPLPELIFLDLAMPEMDGYRFREAQKADPTLAHIPVVVVSGVGHPRKIDARRVLRKPIGLHTLLEALDAELAAPAAARS
jgi:CheY-like chemotaxis protein